MLAWSVLCYGVGQQNSSSSAIIRKTDGSGVGRGVSDSSTGQGVARGTRRPGKEGDKQTEDSRTLARSISKFLFSSHLLFISFIIMFFADLYNNSKSYMTLKDSIYVCV